MMQLICSGVQLDLYHDAGIQFANENPLFAFDNLACERTTQFKLPATPTNDRVLSLARVPAYRGVGLRRKFDAQLVSGVTIKRGYLYVSEFDGKDYAGIFITGELVGLQAIRDAGKLNEILHFDDVIEIVNTGAVSPFAAYGSLWANVAYLKPAGAYVPSISLRLLWDAIREQMDIQLQELPAEVLNVRIIPPKAAGINGDFTLSQRVVDLEQPSSEQPANTFNELQYDSTIFETQSESYSVQLLNVWQYYEIAQFVPRTNIKITFPDDWDNDLYLFSFGNDQFLGERSFNREENADYVTTTGKSLRGRTIEIARGTPFTIVNANDYTNTRTTAMDVTYYSRGFIFSQEYYDLSVMVKIASQESDVPVGDLCRLQDNLPECTIIELAKTIAALSGRVLNYTDAEGIIFDALDVSEWQSKELQQLQSIGAVVRTFADYAQRNTITFAQEEYQSESDHIELAYVIDNDNLESVKELQAIPFTEGVLLDNAIYLEQGGKNFALATDSGNDELARVELQPNAAIQALCDASTQVQVSAHMSLTEYNTITPDTRIYVRGTCYVWTERSWNEDVADFTLARI